VLNAINPEMHEEPEDAFNAFVADPE